VLHRFHATPAARRPERAESRLLDYWASAIRRAFVHIAIKDTPAPGGYTPIPRELPVISHRLDRSGWHLKRLQRSGSVLIMYGRLVSQPIIHNLPVAGGKFWNQPLSFLARKEDGMPRTRENVVRVRSV